MTEKSAEKACTAKPHTCTSDWCPEDCACVPGTCPQQAEQDALQERLRVAFLHVLTLGSHDLKASKWYADELAGIAVREVRRG